MKTNGRYTDRPELVAKVANIFEEVTRSGPLTVPEEWFTVDLTMPQVRALFVLSQEGTLRMGDLASTLGISLSTATGLIDRLIEKELVDRWNDPEDRRSVLCVSTAAGHELSGRLLAARRSRWEERLVPLSVEELERVCDAMDLVLGAARKAVVPVERVAVSDKGK